MGGGGERQSVLHYVRTTVGDGHDVRCLSLGLAAAVYDPQSGDRTGIIIGRQDRAAEGRVANGAVYQHPFDCPRRRWRIEQGESRRVDVRTGEFQSNGVTAP